MERHGTMMGHKTSHTTTTTMQWPEYEYGWDDGQQGEEGVEDGVRKRQRISTRAKDGHHPWVLDVKFVGPMQGKGSGKPKPHGKASGKKGGRGKPFGKKGSPHGRRASAPQAKKIGFKGLKAFLLPS